MKIVLLAVPGAGKSSTIQMVQKEIPNVKKIVYGDYMFEVARKKHGIEDRDDMKKKLSIEDQTKLQEEAAEEIARVPGNIIVDTHGSIKTPLGYWPGLPTNIITRLRPDAIVLLDFNPEAIVKRREKDLKIKKPEVTSAGTIREPRPARYVESTEEVELQQQLNRSFAVAAANQIGCPIKVVNLRYKEKEEFDHAKKAAQEIIKMIKGS